MDIALELKNLDLKGQSYAQDVSRLEGQRDLLLSQVEAAKEKVVSLETQKINEIKGVEILHLVQKSTRDKVVEAFENTVTYALRAIYQDDGYSFKLDFSQRGNLGELNFKVKSPKTQNPLDMKDCTCGGEHDIISLALRFMLLHLMVPKVEGPILFDEPTKMLDSSLRQNEFNFYDKMAKQFKRQLIIVTHSQELAELAENKIVIGA